MKKFIVKILFFFAIVGALDFCIGSILEAMSAKAKAGNAARDEYVFKHVDEDIILMGSSRCIHHYNPFIIEDSLGLSTYNCGDDGEGIIFNYAIYTSMRERHLPKVIIYDVAPVFDLYEGTPNDKYIHAIRPFADYGQIASICADIDNNDEYKLYSKCYRLNSSYLHILRDYIHPRGSFAKGFKPIEGIMAYDKEKGIYNPDDYVVDSVKIKYWEFLFRQCKDDGVMIILAASPTYDPFDIKCFDVIKELAAKYDVPFIDKYDCEGVSGNKGLYYDSWHMNSYGADEFTKILIRELKVLLQKVK